MWTGLGVLTNQWIWGILLVGIALTATAVGVIVWRTRSVARIILITGLLIFSNGFIEYSTSGLENSLAYLAIAVTFALTLAFTTDSGKGNVVHPILLGLSFAAVFLTRFDLIVILAPIAIVLLYINRGNAKTLTLSMISFVAPLVIWFSWSWVTYHSLLPNTFAAKRNVDIPQAELLVQGLRYLYISFENDPVTLIVLVTGVFAGFIFGNLVVRAWTLGVVLYLLYIVSIGGDFMASRFLAVPVVVSAFILAVIQLNPRDSAKEDSERERHGVLEGSVSTVLAVLILGGILVGTGLAGKTPVALANYQSERWQFEQNTNGSISDERGFYVANGKSLKEMIDKLSLAYVNPDIAPLGDGSGLNRTLREINKAAQNWPYADGGFTLPSEVGAFCGGLGYLGIATGPITHLVDTCALTDRFLAQQPFAPAEPFAWRPGHLARPVPEGYLEAIATGDPKRLTDRVQAFELEQLWGKIR
jgi:arabinofuranosyltransferase